MERLLLIVSMVTVLVCVTVDMTNAQGELISSMFKLPFRYRTFCIHVGGYIHTSVHQPFLQ